MEIRAKAQLGAKELFKFLLHHMYFNTSGIIYTVVALLALAGGIYYLVLGNYTGIFLMAICLIYFGVMPALLYGRAVKQSKNEVFQKATDYVLTEEGLYASQGNEDPSHLSWENIRSITYFRGVYIIYISSVRANVIPEQAFSASREQVNALLKKALPKNKLKGI